ncbi:accessory gland protein Acp29AB-like [Drosophila rhopaloa]|uniref:Accessory gland protein Acp29AB-like n=1 Tax=Drosophila rhopaloa TaxID=1041015 RepID=A0A6P4G259_DRORH|nr:accessory gland protein Acp29AB-like [Drosophila rhopaloa]
MSKLKSVFFCAFLAFILNVSGSENTGRSMCLLQDPPNQCGEFCLTALMPLINHIAMHQDQWKTCDNVNLNETQAKLARIEDQLTAVKSKTDEQLQALLVKIGSQQTALLETLSKMDKKIAKLLQFEKIGKRLFYIEHNLKLGWADAIKFCRKMDGQLASIESEWEFGEISKKLKEGTSYTLDINDIKKEGEFIVEATGKEAPFLKWKPGEPRYDYKSQHCVSMHDGGMWADSCTGVKHFICQADDTV